MRDPMLFPRQQHLRTHQARQRGGQRILVRRDLARVLEYLNFRNFQPVIEKAKVACTKSGHAVADILRKCAIWSASVGRTARAEGWMLSRYACYLVIQTPTRANPW